LSEKVEGSFIREEYVTTHLQIFGSQLEVWSVALGLEGLYPALNDLLKNLDVGRCDRRSDALVGVAKRRNEGLGNSIHAPIHRTTAELLYRPDEARDLRAYRSIEQPAIVACVGQALPKRNVIELFAPDHEVSALLLIGGLAQPLADNCLHDVGEHAFRQVLDRKPGPLDCQWGPLVNRREVSDRCGVPQGRSRLIEHQHHIETEHFQPGPCITYNFWVVATGEVVVDLRLPAVNGIEIFHGSFKPPDIKTRCLSCPLLFSLCGSVQRSVLVEERKEFRLHAINVCLQGSPVASERSMISNLVDHSPHVRGCEHRMLHVLGWNQVVVSPIHHHVHPSPGFVRAAHVLVIIQKLPFHCVQTEDLVQSIDLVLLESVLAGIGNRISRHLVALHQPRLDIPVGFSPSSLCSQLSEQVPLPVLVKASDKYRLSRFLYEWDKEIIHHFRGECGLNDPGLDALLAEHPLLPASHLHCFNKEPDNVVSDMSGNRDHSACDVVAQKVLDVWIFNPHPDILHHRHNAFGCRLGRLDEAAHLEVEALSKLVLRINPAPCHTNTLTHRSLAILPRIRSEVEHDMIVHGFHEMERFIIASSLRSFGHLPLPLATFSNKALISLRDELIPKHLLFCGLPGSRSGCSQVITSGGQNAIQCPAANRLLLGMEGVDGKLLSLPFQGLVQLAPLVGFIGSQPSGVLRNVVTNQLIKATIAIHLHFALNYLAVLHDKVCRPVIGDPIGIGSNTCHLHLFLEVSQLVSEFSAQLGALRCIADRVLIGPKFLSGLNETCLQSIAHILCFCEISDSGPYLIQAIARCGSNFCQFFLERGQHCLIANVL